MLSIRATVDTRWRPHIPPCGGLWYDVKAGSAPRMERRLQPYTPARGFVVYCLDLFGISQQHSVMGAVVLSTPHHTNDTTGGGTIGV
jgi:hypothetical protein